MMSYETMTISHGFTVQTRFDDENSFEVSYVPKDMTDDYHEHAIVFNDGQAFDPAYIDGMIFTLIRMRERLIEKDIIEDSNVSWER